MRDYLDAIRRRIVVFDGGMGATLEQYDLSQEDYGGLAGQVPRGARAAPARRDRGRPHGDARGRRAGRRDGHLPGVETQARGVGPRRRTRTRSTSRPPRSRAEQPASTASSPARSARPASCPPPTTRRSATSPSARSRTSSPSRRRGLVEGGADLLIIETAQDILEVKAAIFGAREAFKATGRTVPIQCSVSLLPNGGKMLLGTDIDAVLTTLDGARRRGDRAQLLDRPRGHARRDPLPRRALPHPRPLHPERRPAAAGPRRRDDLPREARAARRVARRVRRALRRQRRRRLLRHDARAHPRDRRARRRTCTPSTAAGRRARRTSPR